MEKEYAVEIWKDGRFYHQIDCCNTLEEANELAVETAAENDFEKTDSIVILQINYEDDGVDYREIDSEHVAEYDYSEIIKLRNKAA